MEEFNSCNNSSTLNQIKSKYDNLKTTARKHTAKIKQSVYTTGRGSAHPPDSQNIIYDEVINISNKKTVHGLSNRYDDSNIIIEEVPYDEIEEANTDSITEYIEIGKY